VDLRFLFLVMEAYMLSRRCMGYILKEVSVRGTQSYSRLTEL